MLPAQPPRLSIMSSTMKLMLSICSLSMSTWSWKLPWKFMMRSKAREPETYMDMGSILGDWFEGCRKCRMLGLTNTFPPFLVARRLFVKPCFLHCTEGQKRVQSPPDNTMSRNFAHSQWHHKGPFAPRNISDKGGGHISLPGPCAHSSP